MMLYCQCLIPYKELVPLTVSQKKTNVKVSGLFMKLRCTINYQFLCFPVYMTMVTDDSPNMSFSLYKCLHKMFFHRGSGTSTVSGPYIIFIRYTGKVWRCILLYSILFILYTSLHHSATCKPGLYYICRAFFLCEVLISLPVCFCELNR